MDEIRKGQFSSGGVRKRPRATKAANAEHLYTKVFDLALVYALYAVDGDTAEDIAQDIATELWRRLTKRGSRQRVPADIEAYVARAVWQAVVTHHESHRKREGRGERFETRRERAQREWMHPEAAYDLRVTEGALRRALRALPEAQQKLVGLIVLDGLTYARAANECGIAVGTVRVQMSRALGSMRRALVAPREERT